MQDDNTIPDGFTVTANNVCLMLVKTSEKDNNPPVYALAPLTHPDPIRELIRRYWRAQEE